MTIPLGFAQITHTFAGDALRNGAAIVYGVEPAPPLTAPELAELADGLFSINVMPQISSDIGLSETLAKLGPDESGSSAVFAGEGGGGGNTDDTVSSAVSYLILKNTALGGRRGRGRIFMPGVGEAQVAPNGALGAGTLVAVGGAFSTWLAALETAGIPMVVLHGPATEWALVGGQPRRVPVAGTVPGPTTVTSLTLSSFVATQRRRQR